MTRTPPPPYADTATLNRADRLSPEDTRRLIDTVIVDAIRNAPRSLQAELGPSELGCPCRRLLGYKMLGHDEVNARRSVPWRAFVGTAVHSVLADIFTEANAGQHPPLWLTEQQVHVGDYSGVPVIGSSDLVALLGAGVVDWKIVGPSSLKQYRRAGHPGAQYRAQAHNYGRGFVHRGLDVDWVAVYFLPSAGDFEDGYYWHEPYDEQVALDALESTSHVKALVDALGPAALDVLTAAEHYCTSCPFYWPGSDDLTRGCPGVMPPAPAPAPAGSLFK